MLLGTGGYKQSSRYTEEKNALLKARKKYDEDKVIFVGHSLGGTAVEALPAQPQDKTYTYNAPLLKPRKDAKHYRTRSDIFSAFNQEAITLPNENTVSANLGSYLLAAHNLENLASQPIFIQAKPSHRV